MNTIRLAISVRPATDYNPLDLCSFIERWATSNNGRIRVSMEHRQHLGFPEYNAERPAPELLFINVEYENYPTTGNYLIEIKQFVNSAVGHYSGIECVGINAA